MSQYVLQARAVVRRSDGQLRRNDTVVDDGDDRAELMHRANSLAAQGYTAWLYERRRVDLEHPSLHLVATVTPPQNRTNDGRR